MSTLAGPVVAPADERHLDAMMSVMRTAFDPRYGESWSVLQLAGTMAQDSSFARRVIDASGSCVGFSLCRAAGPEVELLLIAIAAPARRRGFGSLLIETGVRDAVHRGASEMFLEVRENNAAARQLYRRCGFRDVGHRPDYYAGSAGERFAAITMRRELRDFVSY